MQERVFSSAVNPRRRLRVLISAYACEPNRGSEPAVGWNLVKEASKWCDVWVLTRENNQGVVLKDHAQPSVHWLFYDLPGWVRFLKRKLGLTSIYYLLWQIGSRKKIRRVMAEHAFDLVHHATFGTAFIPPFISCKEVPLLWGPVGGLMSAPKFFFRWFSWRGKVREFFRPWIQFMAAKFLIPLLCGDNLWPLTVSEQSRKLFPERLKARTRLCSQVGISREVWDALRNEPSKKSRDKSFIVLMAGRLEHWKGFAFGIEAFSLFAENKSDVELHVVGDGPEKHYLEKQAAKFGIGKRVAFMGGVSYEKYIDVLRGSNLFLFPSVHEPGAFVVVEALAAGKPVVCFCGTEPATEVSEKTGWRIPLSTRTESLCGFVSAMEACYNLGEKGRQELSLMCRSRASDYLWDEKFGAIYAFYCDLSGKDV